MGNSCLRPMGAALPGLGNLTRLSLRPLSIQWGPGPALAPGPTSPARTLQGQGSGHRALWCPSDRWDLCSFQARAPAGGSHPHYPDVEKQEPQRGRLLGTRPRQVPGDRTVFLSHRPSSYYKASPLSPEAKTVDQVIQPLLHPRLPGASRQKTEDPPSPATFPEGIRSREGETIRLPRSSPRSHPQLAPRATRSTHLILLETFSFYLSRAVFL
ncbi:uncharacterized protein LOC102486309 [Tupaia chinensis]|uniref:uncharacterized protein LOC102486309 n=1 Tax=Tupaia chinensis TaxID=246437 RepID=UPI0003C921C9|nr:uncharacterized protein LOC102486309 [Tupaia chinensis]